MAQTHHIDLQADDPFAGCRPSGIGHVVPSPSVVVELPDPATSFYEHGWHSFSPVRWVDATVPRRPIRDATRQLMADDVTYGNDTVHGGNAVGAVDLPGGSVVLLGAMSLSGRVSCEGSVLSARYEDEVGDWFIAVGSEQDVFAAYAGVLRDQFGSRPLLTRGPTWCSWYSLYRSISEPKLHEVLEDLGDSAFETFQVDDGWQREIGDWQANDKFPSGMSDLADRVVASGRTPGLWFAPFIAHARSEVFRSNPHWFVTHDNGKPKRAGWNWDGWFYALDATHPGVQQHVVGFIRDALGWGYRYLKLDFLYAAGVEGGRHDQSVSREEAYRRGVQLIRDEVGDDVYLLACGAPIVPSLGVFDGIRVSCDVAPEWENEALSILIGDLSGVSTRHAILTTLHRFWLKDVIDIDPDVVYFRTRYNLLTDSQREALQDCVSLTGFVATSDPPAWLMPDERADLDRFIAERPVVTRTGRFTFTIDDRPVDFSWIAEPGTP